MEYLEAEEMVRLMLVKDWDCVYGLSDTMTEAIEKVLDYAGRYADLNDEPPVCSRPDWPHDTCNGYPCAPMLELLRGQEG